MSIEQLVRFGSEADTCIAVGDVRFGPQADIAKKERPPRGGLSQNGLSRI